MTYRLEGNMCKNASVPVNLTPKKLLLSAKSKTHQNTCCKLTMDVCIPTHEMLRNIRVYNYCWWALPVWDILSTVLKYRHCSAWLFWGLQDTSTKASGTKHAWMSLSGLQLINYISLHMNLCENEQTIHNKNIFLQDVGFRKSFAEPQQL